LREAGGERMLGVVVWATGEVTVAMGAIVGLGAPPETRRDEAIGRAEDEVDAGITTGGTVEIKGAAAFSTTAAGAAGTAAVADTAERGAALAEAFSSFLVRISILRL
jgi:hypothetical protein